MILDSERNILTVKNKYIYLSPIENIILTLFIENKNKVILRDEIEKALKPYYINNNCLYQHLNKLNKKIENYMHIRNRGHRKWILIIF